jgi:hypothetical protein
MSKAFVFIAMLFAMTIFLADADKPDISLLVSSSNLLIKDVFIL